MFDRQRLGKAGNLVGQPLRHALIPIEVRHRLHRRIAARGLQACARHIEPRVALEQRRIARAPRCDVAHLEQDLAAATKQRLQRLGTPGFASSSMTSRRAAMPNASGSSASSIVACAT